MNTFTPHQIGNIDRVIAARLREKRIAKGQSQVDIGKVIGVSHQQIQKYESGTNRLTASALFLLAKHFGVTIDSFFENVTAIAAE